MYIIYIYIYIYYVHLAFVGFDHSVCRGSQIAHDHLYIYIYIYIQYIYKHNE